MIVSGVTFAAPACSIVTDGGPRDIALVLLARDSVDRTGQADLLLSERLVPPHRHR